MMLRYGFVPYRRQGQTLEVVVSDPSDLATIDEVGVQLKTLIRVCVGAPSAIQSILKKSESSQRVLEEATEGFQIQILREDDLGDETLTVDKLTSDASPVIRLVDSMLFTALQRRASDIHIETQDDSVHVKYRIDGVLQRAMNPIDKRHHSTIISRIKVMAELDIAEKRVPQDGRFRVKIQGRSIDFRVSIMPSVHGEDAVIRILDKESLSKQFASLRLDVLGFERETTSTGWKASMLLLIQNGVVVYKLWSGTPTILEVKTESKPLGPLQDLSGPAAAAAAGAMKP